MSAAESVTPAHLHYALLLLARQQGGEPSVANAATEALQRWRTANDLHERAYQKALSAWNGTAASGLQEVVALPRATSDRKRQSMRRGVMLMLGLVSFVITARRLPRQSAASHIMTTAQGEIRTVRLSDGTRVDIGATTTLKLIENEHVRQVYLASGDARFDVVKDASRPFVVSTLFGRVTVIGTEFSVSVTPASMNVAVGEGKVVVRADSRAIFADVDAAGPTLSPASLTSEAVLLTQGFTLDVDQNGLHRAMPVEPSAVGAWREGWMIFERVDLMTAVTRWNRYTQDVIRVRPRDAHALQGMRITGSFAFADEATFLESLPKILPVTVTYKDGLAWLGHRSNGHA